jgi:hypothetical protein
MRLLIEHVDRSSCVAAGVHGVFFKGACGCQPVSSFRLPPLHRHLHWNTWDIHSEAALMQLPAVMADESKSVASGFFREHLATF